MSFNLQDPAFLIPLGVILIGVILFAWALGKLIKKSPEDEFPLSDDTYLPVTDDDRINVPPPDDFLPPLNVREPTIGGSPPATREMADRLDGMAQKLSDMQAVLQRQASTGPTGTPLPPETIDKLLKIIGNVTQQVDILQKSLGTTLTLNPPAASTTHAPAAHVIPVPSASKPALSSSPPVLPAPAPAPAVKPAVSPSPTPAPSVGGKSIGVTGGALSSFGRSAPKPATPPSPQPANPSSAQNPTTPHPGK